MNPTQSSAVNAAIVQGRLYAALELVKDIVRQQPGDPESRARLFQLFCFQGEWDRALTQLQLLGSLSGGGGESQLAVPLFTSLVLAEKVRTEVFSGRQAPVIFGQPPQWMALQLEGVRRLGAGFPGEAASLFGRALESAVPSAGQIDETAFGWLSDVDSRLGPALEAVVHGAYYWVPFSALQSIEFRVLEDLHERLWRPAELILSNGASIQAYLPIRYPDTASGGDEHLLMVRDTAWSTTPEGLTLGFGQRFWATNVSDYPLLKLRRLDFFDISETAPV